MNKGKLSQRTTWDNFPLCSFQPAASKGEYQDVPPTKSWAGCSKAERPLHALRPLDRQRAMLKRGVPPPIDSDGSCLQRSSAPTFELIQTITMCLNGAH